MAADQRRKPTRGPRFETALDSACAHHPPRMKRLHNPLEVLCAPVVVVERTAGEGVRGGCDHDLVRARQPLQTRRHDRRLADRGLRHRGVARAGLAHHHRPRRDPDPHLQRRRWIHALDRLDEFKTCPHGASGVLLMRHRPTEIDHQPIAQILRHMPFVTCDDHPGGFLISRHHVPQILGIELLRQRGRADQIAKHHRDLTALGFPGRFPPTVPD